MDLIDKYFPRLTQDQRSKFEALQDIYAFWNQRVNVISRKDFSNFYERHVLFSMGLAKWIQFADNSKVLDVGTGGGFPGIPLAILFPHVHFTLLDATRKKIKVVEDVAKKIQIENVTALWDRLETHYGHYNAITGRAVTNVDKFIVWVKKNMVDQNASRNNYGVLYYSGGENDIPTKKTDKKFFFRDIFSEAFFQTKVLYQKKEFF